MHDFMIVYFLQKIEKSERLTTLGTLAAEIAHEIRNPLMVVRLLFDSLELSEDADSHQEGSSIIRENSIIWIRLQVVF